MKEDKKKLQESDEEVIATVEYFRPTQVAYGPPPYFEEMFRRERGMEKAREEARKKTEELKRKQEEAKKKADNQTSEDLYSNNDNAPVYGPPSWFNQKYNK